MEREVHAVSSFCVCLKMSMKLHEKFFKIFVRFCQKCHVEREGIFLDMNRDEEIRLLYERLDYYTMEAEDDQFDTEEVIKLLKRLNELEPQSLPLPKKSVKKILEDLWKYIEEREHEERVISEMWN